MKNERYLVRKAVEGDAAAFGVLYQACHEQIYATMVRRTSDPETAQDLVQTAFLKAYGALGSYRGEAAFATWLTQIALNVHKSHFRKQQVRRRWIKVTDDPAALADATRMPVSGENPEVSVERNQQRELVRKSIRALPARYRKVVWMRYVRDWSYEEITLALQIPMGTVKTWLNRGRCQLKGEFKRRGLVPS
ncbi:MAG: sigma-70 family RNA polymerase sigma factor [Gemmatimonadota bacterium]|nr:sigma-70 family RNA polymerase sigma factor [Gemmatimonadota bacterium]